MKEFDTNKKCILVCEDEPAITEVFQRVITGFGFKFEAASDGKLAREMLGEKEYELIFLDIRTPGMTGNELFNWLKEKYPLKAERVIFSTGDTMSGNTQAFLEESGRPFLPKPFTPSELRTIIGKTLRQTNQDGI
jgi:CheY-like chemotaxis protein